MKKTFLVGGLIALALGLIINPSIVGDYLAPDKTIGFIATKRIHSLQLLFFISGIIFLAFYLVDRYRGIAKLTQFIKSHNAFLSLISFISFLLVFEIGFRILGFIPNPFETNNIGLRGKNIFLNKGINTYRILFLGDSVTFGAGVSNKDTYVTKVGEIFQENNSQPQIEALNGGQPGYSTYDELSFLKSRGLRLKPDLVILTFVLNDLVENTFVLQSQPSGAENHGTLVIVRIHKFLSYNSSLYTALRALQMHIRFGSATIIPDESVKLENEEVSKFLVSSNAPEQKKIWQGIKQLLTSMKALLDEKGIKMALIISPWHYQWDSPAGDAIPQNILKRWGQKEGIPVLDFLPVFNKYPVKSVLIDHCHLLPFGHELAAKTIYDFLLNNNRLLKGMA